MLDHYLFFLYFCFVPALHSLVQY